MATVAARQLGQGRLRHRAGGVADGSDASRPIVQQQQAEVGDGRHAGTGGGAQRLVRIERRQELRSRLGQETGAPGGDLGRRARLLLAHACARQVFQARGQEVQDRFLVRGDDERLAPERHLDAGRRPRRAGRRWPASATVRRSRSSSSAGS